MATTANVLPITPQPFQKGQQTCRTVDGVFFERLTEDSWIVDNRFIVSYDYATSQWRVFQLVAIGDETRYPNMSGVAQMLQDVFEVPTS